MGRAELLGENELQQSRLDEALAENYEARTGEGGPETGLSHVQELDEACDEIDRLEWQLEIAWKDLELSMAQAREAARLDHKKELETRVELIVL